MLTLEELTNLTAQELDKEFTQATKDLFKIRFEVNTGSSKASNQIGKLRKYRAQILTIKKNIEIEESKKFQSQKKVEELAEKK